MISDQTKTLAEGAITPWRRGTKRMRAYYRHLQDALVKHFRVNENVPFSELPDSFKTAVYFGTNGDPIEIDFGGNSDKSRPGGEKKVTKPFEGLVPQMQRLYEQTESEFTRNRIRVFMARETCNICDGARLKPEILAVTIKAGPAVSDVTSGTEDHELNIDQFSQQTVEDALQFIGGLALTEQQQTIVTEVVREIQSRLQFLAEVGLGYLTLNRESGTLSGGEAQRIRLATQIGSGLAGVLYILDEPSIGLHQRDNSRLLGTLRRLRDLGNSVIVVEHDEETIRAADHILDLGPGAGPRGGEIVAQGSLNDIERAKNSLTGDYLSGRVHIAVPKQRTQPRPEAWLTVIGASENNLKNIDVSFPLGCLTCVTGVSGSGKSTLVDDILRRALFRHFYNSKDRPGAHKAIHGLEQIDKVVVIDQSPIGRTPRSNPVTYTGAFTPIRELFAQLPAARVRGYDAGRFSFNVKGGRCENCEGGGLIKIEMHFLPDVYVECEVCRGQRYNRETLEITYKGKNIADVLDLTVDEGARFFRNVPTIAEKLNSMLDVGLGYLRLGQAGTTLSGGEAQRVKLATELAKKATGRTVYILDEPTTGLHFADIEKLLEVLMKLRNAGNTIVVIEHNLEMIKCADWIIDLGPEGGDQGGKVVGSGSPEKMANIPGSHTGQYLRAILENK
jgi:excinuclease ABC subunit A